MEADTAPVTDRGRTMSPTAATAAVVALYGAGAVVVYWHVWTGSPSHDTQFGPDTALNTWFLAWAPQALLHGLDPFFSHAGNAPYGINVLANTSELLWGCWPPPSPSCSVRSPLSMSS